MSSGRCTATTRGKVPGATSQPRAPSRSSARCGPGAQTLCLAGLCDGTITAIDTHRPFLDRLDQEIERRGLSARVTVREADMADLPFRDGAFDVIWAEGSLCFLGVERALRAWRRLLADGGALAFTEVSWLKPDVPAEVRDYGKVYPGMADVERNLAVIAEQGYRVLGHFTLPAKDWWTGYYDPIRRKLPGLREEHRNDPAALEVISQHEAEMRLHELHAACYGYEFYVARAQRFATSR